MKRLHVSVSVQDLNESIDYYTTLFGTAPTVQKPDYAKWMLDDPRVNFAIGERGGKIGVDHLGIQAETPDELQAIAARLTEANRPHADQVKAKCCYAESDKTWSRDPQGVIWESFYTHGAETVYGSDFVPVDGLSLPDKDSGKDSGKESGKESGCCGATDCCDNAMSTA